MDIGLEFLSVIVVFVFQLPLLNGMCPNMSSFEEACSIETEKARQRRKTADFFIEASFLKRFIPQL